MALHALQIGRAEARHAQRAGDGGGGREAGGKFIDLFNPQDSQGCQSNAQVDKGSATLPPGSLLLQRRSS